MKLLKSLILFVVLLSSCSDKTDGRVAEIDRLLTSLYTEGVFNGNVLIAEKGKILYEKSFGLLDAETNKELNAGSIFNIASISKTFTALAVMQLVQNELLSLDDDIRTHFPDFPYDGISIENLLTHTSGLYRIQSELIREKIDQKGFTNKEVLEVYKEVKPEVYFPPGQGYKYANTNYILLGSIVEKVSGVPFHSYLNTNVFQKASMTNTFLKKKRVPKELKEEVVSYYRKPKWLSRYAENINTMEVDMAEKRTFTNNYGESAIHTTARDLFNYHMALQKGYLLDLSLVERMYSSFNLTDGRPYEIMNVNSNYPSLTGLSWSIAKDSSKGKIVHHAGGFRGGRNFFIRNVTLDQCIIILTNNDLTDRNTFSTPMRILNGQDYMTDKKSLPRVFCSQYLEKGLDSALLKYNTLDGNENYIPFIDWDFEEIGDELMALGDYQAAIELYTIYTKKYQEDEFSWSLLADAYYAIGNKKQAMENYIKSLDVNPNHNHAKAMIQRIDMS